MHDAGQSASDLRLESLRSYGILDTAPESAFDDIARLAAHICQVPIALISFVDRDRQWFKSEIGLGLKETSLGASICAHALAQDGLFVVNDASADERFAQNPLVTDAPHIRFYAGALLRAADGHPLGTLCVLDRVARELLVQQQEVLAALAGQVMAQLELRRIIAAQTVALEKQEQAERALRQSEDRFRTLLATTTDIVWTTDCTGAAVDENASWSKFTGQKWEELRGYEFADAIHPDDRADVMAWWRETSQVPKPCIRQYRLRRHDGVYRHVIARGAPLLNSASEFSGWIGTCTDVDEREQLLASERAARSEAERVNRMKDEFLATLGHELRTPLNAILGWSELLRKYPVAQEKLRLGLETIERNARVQTALIEDLLDMSRIISGKVRLNVQSVDLGGVIEAAVETVRAAANAKTILLQVLLDADAPPIAADPNRLQQVIWNLLSNAIKYTPAGGRVRVLLEHSARNLEVSVSDTGEGIEPAFLPHVFERFRQFDGSTTRRHGGLGLGLAITQHLVELHGGTIRATSDGRAKGSTFSLTLPLKQAQTTGQATKPGRAENDRPVMQATPSEFDLNGIKVLVVDDESDVRELVRQLLEGHGAAVLTAGSTAEALAIAATTSIGLLISDLGMPTEDGYDLIRKIRDLPAECGGRVPAIALTAYARSEDRTQALIAGFQMHLAKPVESKELLATVASLAGRAGKRKAFAAAR